MEPSQRDLYTDTDTDIPLHYSSGVEDEATASDSTNNGKFVDLSQQYLTFIPNEMFSGPGARFDIKFITELNISNNRFQTLPSIVFQMKSLECLDISNNSLTTISPEFGNLINLKALSARNNLITVLPKTMKKILHLQELNLAGNEFIEFPSTLLQLTNLKSLYLGANKLASLPENIDLLSKLEILYLGGNRLKSVPDALGNLISLSSLALCDNQLETLPPAFGNLHNLQTLSLHNNQIRYLPTEIITLQNLSNLSLRNNPLVSKFVNSVEFAVPSLKELAARSIRINYNQTDYNRQLPKCLNSYLESANFCVNPKCKGVYFEAKSEHVKFTDFCGKFRIPLMEYLCSPRCSSTEPAVAISSDSETEDERQQNLQQPSNSRMRRVLLG
jgi:Leucine-rich repeat (LRR) protein